MSGLNIVMVIAIILFSVGAILLGKKYRRPQRPCLLQILQGAHDPNMCRVEMILCGLAP